MNSDRYHDEEWGVPVHADQKWFEFLVLDAFQAGLSWRTVLNKREAFKRVFHGFDPVQVARMSEKEITAKGWDIDQGMVLKMGEELYYGSNAIHALALISSRSGVFNRINFWVFKSKTNSKWIYPILRFFRNLLLRILNKTKINNLNKPNNEKF